MLGLSREDPQHCCWLLIAWLMSTFAGLMGSVLRGMMCLMINFSCMGHVSSVNESVTLMYAQKMTLIFTLGTERESQIVCGGGEQMGQGWMQSPWFIMWCMFRETSEGDVQCTLLSREGRAAFVCCLSCVLSLYIYTECVWIVSYVFQRADRNGEWIYVGSLFLSEP